MSPPGSGSGWLHSRVTSAPTTTAKITSALIPHHCRVWHLNTAKRFNFCHVEFEGVAVSSLDPVHLWMACGLRNSPFGGPQCPDVCVFRHPTASTTCSIAATNDDCSSTTLMISESFLS